MESQNTQMHCKISPRGTCNPCGFTVEINSRYHRLLIDGLKRNTEIDRMGPFKAMKSFCKCGYLKTHLYIIRIVWVIDGLLSL